LGNVNLPVVHTPFESIVAFATCICAFWYIPDIGSLRYAIVGLQKPLLLLCPVAVSVKAGGTSTHGPSVFPWFEEVWVSPNAIVPEALMVWSVEVGPVAMPEVVNVYLSVNVSHVFCPKATWKAPQPISVAAKNNRFVILVVFGAELGMFFE